MTKLTKHINDAASGEIQIVELTDEEIAQRESEIIAWQNKKQTEKEAAELSWRLKVSAYEKLGLNTEEIEVIAPTPKWLLPPEEDLTKE